MIDKILVSSDLEGRPVLLLGNEAIVRGAIEAGVAMVSSYPGTPASEIGDTLWRLAKELGIRCEYGVNEKVALEVAAGAAQGGIRSMVSFKHLGLNVAADAVPTLANSGVQAGMVIVTAGDPGNHTSPNEQDHRYFARMAKLPMLEPATPEQAKAMTVLAFELSEQLGIPVLLRPTTRVAHTRGVVVLGPRIPAKTQGQLLRDPARFVPLPPNSRRAIHRNDEVLAVAEARLAKPPWTVVEGAGSLGIVSCGVAACYVREAIRDLDAEEQIRHLQIPSVSPLPVEPCRELLSQCHTVLVAEELMPVAEELLRSLALDLERPPKILGKLTGLLPKFGEYNPTLVRPAVAQLLERETESAELAPEPGPLPPRPPVLCPGCPHRASYAAVRLVFGPEDSAYLNDIGCYSLGYGKPLECADFLLCMGSSVTQASGMSTAIAPRQSVGFIGDSTFLHSGITGLLNAVACGNDMVLVILDNSTTAMTGHQPHAGIAVERGFGGSNASIEAIVRGVGVEHLWVVDPTDVEPTVAALKEARDAKGVRVILAKHPCPVDRHRLGHDATVRRYRINLSRCQSCPTREAGIPCSMAPEPEVARKRVLRSIGNPTAGTSPTAPCSEGCPIGVCVPGYTALVAASNLDGAAALVRDRNPLPSVCSRVCHAPCEMECLRGGEAGRDAAVAINAIKRTALDGGTLPPPDPNRIDPELANVAVVGSGPAGLACADELTRRGYPVTMYEGAAEPGGMLRYGIPPYRLPRDVLDRDIGHILGSGVELVCNTKLGSDVTVDELLEKHGALFLGIGAWIGSIPTIPGSRLSGVTDCLTFLEQALTDAPQRLDGQRVAVIGGGDGAIDCARTALRLGASNVSVLYRRGRDQMPAEADEIAAALAEGVELIQWVRPIEIHDAGNGVVASVRCLRTVPGPVGDDGRTSALDMTGSEHAVDVAQIIFSVGQRVDPRAFGGSQAPLELTAWGTVETDAETGATSNGRIFAGGDVTTGPATVVDAMAGGKRAAWSIDVALSASMTDRDVLPLAVPEQEERERTDKEVTVCANCAGDRAAAPHRDAAACSNDFEEIAGPLSLDMAAAEAARCLGCAPCAACDACLTLLGCPAIGRGADGRPTIDDTLCNGCGLCADFCPAGAIEEVVS